MARRNLDELYAGVCDGMTYKEIEAVFPENSNAVRMINWRTDIHEVGMVH
jgi:broad specificity phosphatase PhoE